jgi:hypothetical protein
MTHDNNSAKDGGSNFSFGTRELRNAERSSALKLAQTTTKHNVKADDGGGFDPYNTSGSFDRRKNWTRVGKR